MSVNSEVKNIAQGMIELIEHYSWGGACYASTAIMHTTLKLMGIESTPCLGVVKCMNGEMFDHAWLVVDEAIYDVAIAFPMPNSDSAITQYVPKHGYIAAVDTPNVFYGIDEVLDGEALFFAQNFHNIMNASPYFDDDIDYWDLAEFFAKFHGIDVDKKELIKLLSDSAWVIKRT
jgi:hypothetical protein